MIYRDRKTSQTWRIKPHSTVQNSCKLINTPKNLINGEGQLHRGSTGNRTAKGNVPSHCKMMVLCRNILPSPPLQAVTFRNTAAGLNNALEQINKGTAAGFCRFLGWMGGSGVLCDLHVLWQGGNSGCHQLGFAAGCVMLIVNLLAWKKNCGPGTFHRKPLSLAGLGCAAVNSASCRALSLVSWLALTH